MEKDKALKLIATHGYNVGYGAKKNFATYDIVEKIPGWISFISISYGILSLKYFSENLSSHVSTILIIFGVISLYITHFSQTKDTYSKAGTIQTQIYAKLQATYLRIQGGNADIESELQKVDELMSEFYSSTIDKQILFSDWYAHYKFFIQMQIDWIDEQKNFKLFKDKIPKSFQFVFIALLTIGIIYFLYCQKYLAILNCLQ